MTTLAQFIASIGGIRHEHGGALAGEIERVRAVNRKLKGRNSVFRPSGIPTDQACDAARLEGYPVDDGTFLDLLEQDAFAWADGTVQHRVLRTYEIDETGPFDPDLDPWAGNGDDAPICTVCGALATYSDDGMEPACDDCQTWALRQTDPLGYELIVCDSYPLDALPDEVRHALVLSLEQIT